MAAVAVAQTFAPTPTGRQRERGSPLSGWQTLYRCRIRSTSTFTSRINFGLSKSLGDRDGADSELYGLNAEADKPSSIENLHIMLQNLLNGKRPDRR